MVSWSVVLCLMVKQFIMIRAHGEESYSLGSAET